MKRSKDTTEKQGLVVQIYPNQEQREYISRLFGSCRFIYNQCVAHNIDICRYNKNKAVGATLKIKVGRCKRFYFYTPSNRQIYKKVENVAE